MYTSILRMSRQSRPSSSRQIGLKFSPAVVLLAQQGGRGLGHGYVDGYSPSRWKSSRRTAEGPSHKKLIGRYNDQAMADLELVRQRQNFDSAESDEVSAIDTANQQLQRILMREAHPWVEEECDSEESRNTSNLLVSWH